MKTIFSFLLLFSVYSVPGYGQTKAKFSYLTVTMKGRHDGENGGWYLVLVPEKDNPNSAVIDSLVKYKSGAKADTEAQFYRSRKATSHIFYNYFKTVSESLEFLDERGWMLVTIFADASGANGTVVTDPVYYFRKEN